MLAPHGIHTNKTTSTRLIWSNVEPLGIPKITGYRDTDSVSELVQDLKWESLEERKRKD